MPEIIRKAARKASIYPSGSGFLSTRCLLSLSDSVPQATLGGERSFVRHLSAAAAAARPAGSGRQRRSPDRDGAAVGTARILCPGATPKEPRGRQSPGPCSGGRAAARGAHPRGLSASPRAAGARSAHLRGGVCVRPPGPLH